MERIRSRLQSHIDDRAGLPSIFGGRVFLNIKFLNGINRENGGGVSGDASAIDDALAGKWLAVKKAVNKIGVVFRAQAVGACGRESAAGITHHAGAQLQKIFIVAAVQRKVVDLFVTQCATQRCGGGVEQSNVFRNRHHFRNVSCLECEIRAYIRRDFDNHIRPLHRLEAFGFHVNLVGSRSKVGGDILSGLVSGQGS